MSFAEWMEFERALYIDCELRWATHTKTRRVELAIGPNRIIQPMHRLMVLTLSWPREWETL